MKALPTFVLVTAAAIAANLGTTFGADVAVEYGLKCAGCHGIDGKANTPAGKKHAMKDLTDAKVQAKATDAEWERIIKEGVDTPDGKTAMPAYAARVKPEMITALTRYCRSFARK
jgi:mono/diheme cytochrome c family protein